LLKVVLVLFQHPNTQTSHSLKRERERDAHRMSDRFLYGWFSYRLVGFIMWVGASRHLTK